MEETGFDLVCSWLVRSLLFRKRARFANYCCWTGREHSILIISSVNAFYYFVHFFPTYHPAAV